MHRTPNTNQGLRSRTSNAINGDKSAQGCIGVLIASALAVLLSEKHKFCCIYQILNLGIILKLVITKGYGVLATTIESQNAFGPTLYFL